MDPGTQERGCPGAQESRIGTTQFPADGDWHGNPNERTSPDPVVPVLDGVPRAVPLARHRVRHLGLPGWWISPFVPSGSCEGFSPTPTGAATETGAEPHTARAEALAESLSSQTRVGNAAPCRNHGENGRRRESARTSVRAHGAVPQNCRASVRAQGAATENDRRSPRRAERGWLGFGHVE